MNKLCFDTLDDLVLKVHCAKECLVLINYELDDGEFADKNMVVDAIYGVYNQLTWLCDEMSKQVTRLPVEMLKQISEEVHNVRTM